MHIIDTTYPHVNVSYICMNNDFLVESSHCGSRKMQLRELLIQNGQHSYNFRFLNIKYVNYYMAE